MCCCSIYDIMCEFCLLLALESPDNATCTHAELDGDKSRIKGQLVIVQLHAAEVIMHGRQ